ncbi:MAG: hypothetical protein AAF990_13450 [Bacteroidota bacterium]
MDYTQIKSTRQFKATTGYSKPEFEELYKYFSKNYKEEFGQSYKEYIEENVTEPPKFDSLDKCLYFILFQLKNDMTFDSLGAVFGMDGSTAHNNFKRFLPMLEQTLRKKSLS